MKSVRASGNEAKYWNLDQMWQSFAKNWAGHARLQEGVKLTLPIFLTATIFSFFINLLMFVSPLYMLQIYDRVVTSRSETTLAALTILAALLLLVYAALEGLRSRLLVRAGLIFDEKIADPVFEAIHKGNVRCPRAGIHNASAILMFCANF